MPDIIVVADTGYEKGTTWEYMERITAPSFKKKFGMQIHRIKDDHEDWETRYIQRYTTGKEYILPPVFFNYGVNRGKLRGLCSDRWKKYAVRRYLRSIGVSECDLWIGISANEMGRAKPSNVKWLNNVYPLISRFTHWDYGLNLSLNLNRNDCLNTIQSFGWPIPKKSSCYICPHMTNKEWMECSDEEIKMAIDIEKGMQRIAEPGKSYYLHRALRPLSQIDFSSKQEDLFSQCQDMSECSSWHCHT